MRTLIYARRVSMLVAAAGLITCAVIAAALIINAEDQTVPEPAPPPERSFKGTAYLYQDDRRFSKMPTFVVKSNRKDRPAMRDHVRNLSRTRHWVHSDGDGWTRTYVMPDYDVAIIEEIERTPVIWAHKFSRDPGPSPALPPAESMMAVRIDFDTDPRTNLYQWGSAGAGVVGLVGLLCVAVFSDAIANARKKQDQECRRLQKLHQAQAVVDNARKKLDEGPA